MAQRVIRSIDFGPSGVALVYQSIPDDYREEGLLLSHRLEISGPDWQAEVAAVEEAAVALLEDALEDFARLPIWDPELEEDDDEEDDDDED